MSIHQLVALAFWLVVLATLVVIAVRNLGWRHALIGFTFVFGGTFLLVSAVFYTLYAFTGVAP